LRSEDERLVNVIFLASCILNPYYKVRESIRDEKIRNLKKFVNTLLERKIGIIQVPCPETIFLGIGRKPASRDFYDTPEFRELCKEIAEWVVKRVHELEEGGIHILGLVGVEGSPSCGVRWTHRGRGKGERARGAGVFIEELRAILRRDNIPLEIFGLPETEKYGDLASFINIILEEVY